VDDLISTIRS
jgi:dynein heavy chain